MPNKCCVPGCKSNYKSVREGYVPVFTFPADSALKNLWIQSIPRVNWTCTKNSVVCLKHFSDDCLSYVERYKDAKGQWKEFPRSRSKLLPTAVPSIFPTLPSHLSVKRKGRRVKQRCDEKESGDEQGIDDDCVIIQDVNERQPLVEEEIKVENVRTEPLEECEMEVAKQEPFEEIEIKDECIFDEEEEKRQEETAEDACEPFASVMVTPSEDDVIEDEGQLQMDPLAVDVAMQWRQRVRQRQERVQCDVCDKTFRLSVMLEVHKRNQCRAPSYTCDVCEKKFQKKSDLSTHSQSHHTTKSKARAKQPYGCVTCSSRFSELSSLLQHQRIHSSGYACHVCGKTFAKKSDQVLHTRIHTGEKPYQCHFCAKKFSLLSRIRKHWEVHGIPFKKNLYH